MSIGGTRSHQAGSWMRPHRKARRLQEGTVHGPTPSRGRRGTGIAPSVSPTGTALGRSGSASSGSESPGLTARTASCRGRPRRRGSIRPPYWAKASAGRRTAVSLGEPRGCGWTARRQGRAAARREQREPSPPGRKGWLLFERLPGSGGVAASFLTLRTPIPMRLSKATRSAKASAGRAFTRGHGGGLRLTGFKPGGRRRPGAGAGRLSAGR